MLQRVMLLVLCLTEMGVEPHAVLTGQQSALPQKFSADGERRAGGQGDLMHRAGAGIVILLQDAAGIPQDLIHSLYHAVRRQSAVLPGEVHAAPGGKHSDAQGFCGLQLGADQISGACGKDIVVVKAGSAAVLEQFSASCQRGKADDLLVQPLPNLVQGRQPVKQFQPLDLRQVAGEDLIEVMVGVDQSGICLLYTSDAADE